MKIDRKDLWFGVFMVAALAVGILLYYVNAELDRQTNTYEIGTSVLHKGEGVSRYDMNRAGGMLAAMDLYADSHAQFQLCLRNRRYEFRIVVRLSANLNPQGDLLRQYRIVAMRLSSNLNNAPVDVHLCNDSFKTLKIIPYQPLQPNLPVTISFRPSVGGGGLVAKFTNTSDQYLAVRLILTNPTLNKRSEVQLKLKAKSTTEHGWFEGWEFQSGEILKLEHADYETLEAKVP